MPEKTRLYCFPYGGAGASMYRAWGRSLPDWVEVVPVHFPGREHRIREAPHSFIEPVVCRQPSASASLTLSALRIEVFGAVIRPRSVGTNQSAAATGVSS